jgi:hypothetical protein
MRKKEEGKLKKQLGCKITNRMLKIEGGKRTARGQRFYDAVYGTREREKFRYLTSNLNASLFLKSDAIDFQNLTLNPQISSIQKILSIFHISCDPN